MTISNNTPSRLSLLQRSGLLAVTVPRKAQSDKSREEEPKDILVSITDEDQIFAFSGKVDLGTGINTALAQIVAEELDVPVEAVTMVLGHTNDVPDDGPTIASLTMQVTAVPMRKAAAQARQHLLKLAASALDTDVSNLRVVAGRVHSLDDTRRFMTFGELLRNRRDHLDLDPTVQIKDVSDYQIVGKPVPRTDIPAKALGTFQFVHDVRVPNMLHGRVVRPPYASLDSGAFIGKSLESVDRDSIAHIPGIVAIVIKGDFIGIIAEREEQAAEAAQSLKVNWKPWVFDTDLSNLQNALRANSTKPRRLIDEGDVDAALASAENRLDRTYVWPYQLHASIGPSCAVADAQEDGITIWAAPQSPYMLRADISLLTDVPEHRINIIRLEAAGCYGRNGADDVAADAVLLSQAVRRPVRVQLTREQENLWDAKGSSQLIDVSGAIGPGGSLLAYDFQSRYPSNAAPTLALFLTGRLEPVAQIRDKGDRTARPQYNYENLRVTIHDTAPIVRTGWLRGISALPNVFAHESFIDELAEEASEDPLDFRLRHVSDPRAAALTKATAERADWERRVGPNPQDDDVEILRGRGVAQAQYIHGNWPGTPSAYSAWVAEVAVNRKTGHIDVSRLVVGQDTGLMINPAGVRHQIEGNIIQSTSRVLKEQVEHTETGSSVPQEWGAYPIITFPELPKIDIVMLEKQSEPPLGSGESASIPSAAAIVNAIYDATGVRFREIPLTPERVLEGLEGRKGKLSRKRAGRRKRSIGAIVAGLTGALGFGAIAIPLNTPLAPITRPDPSMYSQETIAWGAQLAALGACSVCHTAPGGEALAGGFALETPFGKVMTTNITPDVKTGIGSWSYPAFARAMRDGIHRDGYNLYPAFPYPSFAKTSEADMQALYAYLMAQPAVSRKNIPSELTFPFNLRPLMAGWNLLFNRNQTLTIDPAQSEDWNRGQYLVEGLGHCGACHTPRNLMGAEKTGAAHLSGGVAEGWDAPALTSLAKSPVPWTKDALFTYLRTGASANHGVAAGPMAPVIEQLKALPDSDINAMATYLASLNPDISEAEAGERRESVVSATSSANHPALSAPARLFDGACAMCHEPGRGPVLFNEGPPLGLSTKLHLDNPDNFLRTVMHGVEHTVHSAMPGFGNSLSDEQIADLANYARDRFAPDKTPWTNVAEKVQHLRHAE